MPIARRSPARCGLSRRRCSAADAWPHGRRGSPPGSSWSRSARCRDGRQRAPRELGLRGGRAGVDRAAARSRSRRGRRLGDGARRPVSSGTKAKVKAIPLLVKRMRSMSATKTFGPAVPAASSQTRALTTPFWPSGHSSSVLERLAAVVAERRVLRQLDLRSTSTSRPVWPKKSLSRALRPVVAVWNGWMWITPSWWVWMPPGSGVDSHAEVGQVLVTDVDAVRGVPVVARLACRC